jgi:hypothetical protein
MGSRFRRNFKVASGSRINARKSGGSQSIRRGDVRFTFGPHETRTTVGIRGSGVSSTERTPIRQGRTKTGGLLDAVIYVGLLLVGIALFA